jgi:hypothetical protein
MTLAAERQDVSVEARELCVHLLPSHCLSVSLPVDRDSA